MNTLVQQYPNLKVHQLRFDNRSLCGRLPRRRGAWQTLMTEPAGAQRCKCCERSGRVKAR